MELTDKELENIITKVNEIFYDDMYEDEWLSKVFANTKIEIIKSQQTDFMLGVLGGPKRYGGRSPKDAHPHIFIQEDMWELREQYLRKALNEVNAPDSIQQKWLAIDNAFKNAILKGSIAECVGRYKTEPVIIVLNPKKIKIAA
jgi:truncated hemoglobin YjbI